MLARRLGHFYEPAAFPLLGALTVAVGAAFYVGFHQIGSHDVSISKANPYPWQAVDPASQPRKLYISDAFSKTSHVNFNEKF